MPFNPLALLTRGAQAFSPPPSSPAPIGLPLRAISAFGNLADLPGSMVRDLLVGENPFDQVMSPLSDTGRVSGRDVLSRYGMRADRETGMSGWLTDPGEALRDIAGFGIEYATDPFGPFGKLAKAAGLALGAGKLVSLSPLAAAAAGAGTALKAAAPKLMAALPAAAVAMVQKRAANPRAAKALAEGLQALNKGDDVADVVSKPMRPQAGDLYRSVGKGYITPQDAKKFHPRITPQVYQAMVDAGELTPVTAYKSSKEIAEAVAPEELQYVLNAHPQAFAGSAKQAVEYFSALATTPMTAAEAGEVLRLAAASRTPKEVAEAVAAARPSARLNPTSSAQKAVYDRRGISSLRQALADDKWSFAFDDAVRGRGAVPYTDWPTNAKPSIPASPLASETPPPTPEVLPGQRQLFDPETAPLTSEPQVVPPTAAAPGPVSTPEELAAAQRLADIRQSLDEFNAENPLPPASPPQSPLAQAAPEVTPEPPLAPPVKKRRAPRRKKAESPLAENPALTEAVTNMPETPSVDIDKLLESMSFSPESFMPAQQFGSPLQQVVPNLNPMFSAPALGPRPPRIPIGPAIPPQVTPSSSWISRNPEALAAALAAGAAIPYFMQGGSTAPARPTPPAFNPSPDPATQGYADVPRLPAPAFPEQAAFARQQPQAFQSLSQPSMFPEIPERFLGGPSIRPMTEQERLQRDEELRQMLLEQVINEILNSRSPFSGY